ncbi:MAG TPA: glycogen debranching enzyme N-terminal domain-containing protein [Candidatus Udaeobacter sp.]|jgi:hypothetical protein|nr:glycogen debranching enzyme N-terminal domain-containing protein [Candidatus Udaeobacter sp.]
MRRGQDVPAAGAPIAFDPPPAAETTEWLIADGLGGSASGTFAGVATRRTHALLTAIDQQRPVSLLLALDERLTDARGAWDLSASAPARAHAPAEPPHGAAAHARIDSFTAEPAPTWRIRAGETLIQKRIELVQGHHAVMVTYRHLGGPEARLTVGPCVVSRSPLELQKEDQEVLGAAQGIPGRVRIEMRSGDPALTLWHNGAFIPARVWRRGITYVLDPPREPGPEDAALEAAAESSASSAKRARSAGARRTRGAKARTAPTGDSESALVPGWIDGTLAPSVPVVLVIATEEDLFRKLAAEGRLGAPPPRSLAECVTRIEDEHRARAGEREVILITGADYTARQAASAHQSPMARRRDALVDRNDRWALPLGRALDRALIQSPRAALAPGLPVGVAEAGNALRAVPALVTLRRFEETRAILASAIEYLDEGFAHPAIATPGSDTDPESSLWLVAAAEIYIRRSDDLEFLNGPLYPALEGVMQFYRGGTRGVRLGAMGLLEIERDGVPSAPADLNALWYHALAAMAQLARLAGRKESGAFYLAWARELRQVFGDRLWDESRGRLFDRIENGEPVPALRPSHVLAASLHPLVLTPERARLLIDSIERELFTPFGLRETEGSEVALTSWLGPYLAAYVRAHGREAGALSRAHDWLEMLREARGGSLAAGIPSSFRLAGNRVERSSGIQSTAAAGELLRAWIEDLDPCAAPAPDRHAATSVTG